MEQNELSKIEINFNKLHNKKPKSSTYCLSSYENLYSNIDFEKKMLLIIYKMFKSRLKDSSQEIKFDGELSSEALTFFRYCSFKFIAGYYKDYTIKSVSYRSFFVYPISTYMKYNDEGFIDSKKSSNGPKYAGWRCMSSYFLKIIYPESKEYIENSSDFEILKSLALINPFFACMEDEVLNEIIKSISISC